MSGPRALPDCGYLACACNHVTEADSVRSARAFRLCWACSSSGPDHRAYGGTVLVAPDRSGQKSDRSSAIPRRRGRTMSRRVNPSGLVLAKTSAGKVLHRAAYLAKFMNSCPPKLPRWVEFPGLSAQGQFLTPRGRGNTRTRTVPAGSSRFQPATSIFRFDAARSDDRYPGREDSCLGARHHQPSPSGLWLEHCAPFG